MHRSEVFRTCLLTLLAGLLQTATAGKTRIVSSCFDNANKTLNINCGRGYMVHITRAFYGYSAGGRCRLATGRGEAGCTKDDKVSYECVGKERCAINLPTGQRGLNIPACGQPSNYFQVHYQCVAAQTVRDICQEEILTDQSGYIKTPSFPLNYKQQGMCRVKVEVHPSQKIRMKIIDLNLKDSGHTSCADYIYFNDKVRSITLCSHRNNNTYEWLSNVLLIELQSTSGGQSKGFWLYYEAFPPLTNTLPTPEPPTDVVDSSEEDNRNHNHDTEEEEETTPAYRDPETTVPLIRNRHHRSNKLPFAAIAGGVIGTLSLILVILLLMLFVKWLRERQYYRAEKILEIRNPAFRSSGDFYEQQPNYNDYPC